jgi:hypothetical protein
MMTVKAKARRLYELLLSPRNIDCRSLEKSDIDLIEVNLRGVSIDNIQLIRKAYRHTSEDHCPTRTMKPRIKYDCNCSDERLGCSKAIQAIESENETYKNYCVQCNKVLDYEPETCCDGKDCGCRGNPDPMTCSKECFELAYGKNRKQT